MTTEQRNEIKDVLELVHDFEPDQLRELARKLEVKADLAAKPTHRIEGQVRPQYLRGCPGTIGGFVSDRRIQFFPQPGTKAYARGRSWRVTAEHVKPIVSREA